MHFNAFSGVRHFLGRCVGDKQARQSFQIMPHSAAYTEGETLWKCWLRLVLGLDLTLKKSVLCWLAQRKQT